MTDSQSAALLTAIGGIAFIIWYRGRSGEERGRLFGGVSTSGQAGIIPPEQRGEKAWRHAPIGEWAEHWGLALPEQMKRAMEQRKYPTSGYWDSPAQLQDVFRRAQERMRSR